MTVKPNWSAMMTSSRKDLRPARRRAIGLLLAAAAATTGVAACGSNSGPSATGSNIKHVTLVVQNGDAGETALLAGYKKLNAEFEARHPGVTIEFVTKNFTDLVNSLKSQLSGSNVPDITQVNQGYASMGALVAGHMLTNLDGYARQYGWTGRQAPSLLAADGRFSAEGKAMGSGPLWGMSATGGWVGLYENTQVAHQLGINARPQTFAQLTQDLATAQRHRVVPLQYGSADGGESAWLLATLIAAQDSPKTVLNLVDASSGSSMTSSGVLAAASTIQNWSHLGYFTPNWSRYSNSDVFAKFADGKGLFALNGSWNVPVSGTAGGQLTMIPFPSVSGPSALAGIATGDIPWAIPAKAANAAVAAEYLNFITGKSAASTWIEAGEVPSTLPTNTSSALRSANVTGLAADAVTGWQHILTSGTALPYINWSTPTFYSTIESATESLAACADHPGRLYPATTVRL